MSNQPRKSDGTGHLTVQIVPGLSRNQIVRWLGDGLKIEAMAPRDKGRANEAVGELLADRLGVSTDDIEIVDGHSSTSKMITITGMDEEAKKGAGL